MKLLETVSVSSSVDQQGATCRRGLPLSVRQKQQKKTLTINLTYGSTVEITSVTVNNNPVTILDIEFLIFINRLSKYVMKEYVAFIVSPVKSKLGFNPKN